MHNFLHTVYAVLDTKNAIWNLFFLKIDSVLHFVFKEMLVTKHLDS